jgi:hypothetical protein
MLKQELLVVQVVEAEALAVLLHLVVLELLDKVLQVEMELKAVLQMQVVAVVVQVL